MSRVTCRPYRDQTAQADDISSVRASLGLAMDTPITDIPSKRPVSGSGAAAVTKQRADAGNGKGVDGHTEEESTGPSAIKASIIVAVRKRPRIMDREETETDVVRCGGGGTHADNSPETADSPTGRITVFAPRIKVDLTPVIEPSTFTLDYVFDEKATNADVYEATTRPSLQAVKEGGSAVVFAFGQTGSGKTYTMMGDMAWDGDKEGEGVPGLYSMAVAELLELVGGKVNIFVSFYEVYGAKCYDLLNVRNEVRVMQDEFKNVNIIGIVEKEVTERKDIMSLLLSGSALRSSGATHANDRSSRSHAVLVINLKTPKENALYSRMTFVDLAGSERARDTTDMDIRTRREGAEINKSLLALKECIRAMGMKKKHIPFRGSKLTQILRESFIGNNCVTCIIANVSPCQGHCEDTLNTLRYADRIKELKCDRLEAALPVICDNCSSPIFVGDRHICRRVVVQCQFCRENVDKINIEAHMSQCKEAPMPCPYCGSRILQRDIQKHQNKCMKFPIRCPMCGDTTIPRETMPKHQREWCVSAKVSCRHCRAQFARGDLATHEEECVYMEVVCQKCLMPMKKMRYELHITECRGGRDINGEGHNRGPTGRLTSVGVNNVNPLKIQRKISRSHVTLKPTNSGPPAASSRCSSPTNPGSPTLTNLKSPVCAKLFKVNGRPPPISSNANTNHAFPLSSIAPHTPKGTHTTNSNSLVRLPGGGGAAVSCIYCGKRLLPLAMDTHVKTDCQYAPIPCNFAKYGCKVSMHRLHLTSHMTDYMANHLELVVEYAENLSRDNDDLRILLSDDGHLSNINRVSLDDPIGVIREPRTPTVASAVESQSNSGLALPPIVEINNENLNDTLQSSRTVCYYDSEMLKADEAKNYESSNSGLNQNNCSVSTISSQFYLSDAFAE